MKVDRTKSKRSSTEVPPDCKVLIDKIKSCKTAVELYPVLSSIDTWTYGKCELYHWIDVLDIFDIYLEQAAQNVGCSKWAIALDAEDNEMLRLCVTYILNFTTLLIEHSFSRHLYNSMDHLVKLLNSVCMRMVLDVLQLLYMFSKRSNFLTRLPEDRREGLLERLTYIADSWGGNDYGFGLARCCKDLPLDAYPPSAQSAHMEFSNPTGESRGKSDVMTVIHYDDVNQLGNSPAVAMYKLLEQYSIPEDKQTVLYTNLRLAFNFADFPKRCQCVQARLQALSILVYANALHDNNQQLLYSGLMEEIVEVLELEDRQLTEIKAACLRALTSIIHLDRAQNFPSIIDVTGIGSYHGFLPMMVRNCISSMITLSSVPQSQPYPISLATALFSFVYHLASYELGGEALVSCGMLESLLKVVTWKPREEDQITFVTRAVRVIDLITNMDMQGFHTHGGLNIFINRLESEVSSCRKEQPFEIIPEPSTSLGRPNTANSQDQDFAEGHENSEANVGNPGTIPPEVPMDTDSNVPLEENTTSESTHALREGISGGGSTNFVACPYVCLPQRAALLKSLLNFLKKVIQDASFSDSIRHIMETSLPGSLRHIISNAEYYGSSLFLLATDVVTVYVFQEPSLLSALQDSGLTDVVQEAILVKNVPATREVIASIPNIFSALCLNNRGLNAFLKCKPFHKICKLLISPQYLAAMRRRRSAEPMGDTATNLGNAMDELMRHQPGLRAEATTAMVKLLQDLCLMSHDVRDSCWKEQAQRLEPNLTTTRPGTSEVGSSEEDDDDDEPSISSQPQANQAAASTSREVTADPTNASMVEGNPPPPMVDYIFNVMKFLDAILSNNSTDDHCREFVTQQGIKPLMSVFSLPNLPLDFPNTTSCQAVSAVCKSILCLARENKVLEIGMSELDKALTLVEQLGKRLPHPGSSILLHELAMSKCMDSDDGNFTGESDTPILASMTAVHSFVMMFIQVCRTGQPDIRSMSTEEWGSYLGDRVLQKLSKLYLNLVWESTVLLAICSGEYKPGPNEFARTDLDILVPPCKERDVYEDTTKSGVDQMEIDGSEQDVTPTASRVSSSTQTNVSVKSDKANTTLQEYARLLKPILSASSRLGRALAELFGLLVKLAVGSPLRQRRGHPLPTQGIVSPWADIIAGILAQLLAHGLRWEPIPTSPVPKLQLSICAVGFSSPLLFDEKRFPYHLMLKKFIDTEGLAALFDLFYWAMNDTSGRSGEDISEASSLSEQQVEFLDSWLVLIERFVNPKMILESPHVLPAKNGFLTRHFLFDPSAFLGHVHKLAFKAILYLWKNKPIRMIGCRPADLMLLILCNILRHKEQIDLKATGESSEPQATTSSNISGVDTNPGTTSGTSMSNDPHFRAPHQIMTPGTSRLVPFTGLSLDDIFASDSSDDSDDSTHTSRTHAPTTRNVLPTVPPSVRGRSPPRPQQPTHTLLARQDPVNNVQIEGSIQQEMRDTSGEVLGSTELSVGTSAVAQATMEAAPSTAVFTDITTETTAGGVETAPAINTTTNPADVSNGNNTATDPAAPPAATSTSAARALRFDSAELQQLLDMGFPQNLCVEALISTQNILQATDYLLNMAATLPRLRAISGSGLVPQPRIRNRGGEWTMELDYHEEEDIFRAIIMSMDEQDKASKPQEKFEYESLNAEEIEEFTETVFEKCLELVEQVPESVYRVCELLVAVGHRKGPEWMGQIVKKLMHETMELARTVIRKLTSEGTATSPNSLDNTLCIRIHLFSLMFEEVKSNCFELVQYSSIISLSIELMQSFQNSLMNAINKGVRLETPKWIAPAILLVDLYEKAATATRRKGVLGLETDHLWKWYDINSGKWCTYSTANNQIIDKAFWDGESSVRITAGRRRYVINFGGMVQLNEETSNRRPITLWLKPAQKDHPSMLRVMSNINTKTRGCEPRENSFMSDKSKLPTRPAIWITSDTMELEEVPIGNKKMVILNGLSHEDILTVIVACVEFISLPVEPETLHATLRLCLRVTRKFEYAILFSDLGGVTALLNLTSMDHFNGFLPLANLIIRHCMEDPVCLRFGIEKMIREKVCTPCAATCKELHYLLRVLAPMACRAPDIFVDVAKEILRVDIPFVTRRGILADEDKRLVVKPVPCKPDSFRIHSNTVGCTRDVIHKLLIALAERYDDDEDDSMKKYEGMATAKCSRPGGPGGGTSLGPGPVPIPRGDLAEDPFEQMDLDVSSSASTPKSAKNEVNEKSKTNKPLIPKCAILQLLAESVHSYTYACKVIAEFSYEGGSCKNVTEDCTALGFLLDRFGPVNQFLGNKDCNTILRELLAAMAGCNHLPEAQSIVICEVKAALQRLLSKRESQEKHLKIQYLLNLISYMIETCPTSSMIQYTVIKPPHMNTMNHVVRLLIRKNVVTDLARVIHHVDLTSKYVAQTINASLKCLELISRVVNIPTQPVPIKPRQKSESAQQDSDNNTHTVATSNSEGTRAQGEETVEDAENTEHDISAAAESLDPISEGHTQDHDNAEQDEEAFEEIMDQLLDRENAHGDDVLNESHNSLMDTETNEEQRRNETYDREHDGRDSDSSISEGSSEDEDDDEDEDDEDGHNNEGDDDDEDDDDDDEADEEDALSNYDDPQDEERLLRAPPLDRDDEMLMVQYGGGDLDTGPIFFTNNTTYNYNLGLFEETLMSEQSNVGLRLNHPLLQPPSTETTVHGAVARGHRTGRQRRYQYFQYINSRHPPPPAILQRLLGPSTAQDVIQLTTGQTLNHQGMRDARLLVMDASTDQAVNRGGGNGSVGALSNFTALHWWCEEAKVLDGESMHDCIVAIKREIVEAVESDRDSVFQARREKRKLDEEAKKKTQEQSNTGNAPITESGDAPGTSLLTTRTAAPLSIRREVALVTDEEIARVLSPNPERIMHRVFGDVASGRLERENIANNRGELTVSAADETLELEDPQSVPPLDEGLDGTLDLVSAFHAPGLTGLESSEVIDWFGDMPRRRAVDSTANGVASSNNDPQPPVAVEDTPLSETRGIGAAERTGEILRVEQSNISVPIEIGGSGDREPIAGPSGMQNHNFRDVLGDLEIPEGVDPSFLAALPEEMRQEVISEHLRVQRLRQRATQPVVEVPTTTAIDVSPEFLAALPLNIQEEVLAQQRLEQQRRVAITANPNEPVDAEAFFRTLQPNLRQVILADMEESQMAAIPAEFAEEAQNLRRNWVTRNRQLIQERFFHNHATASTTLSSILRNSGMRLSARYGLHGGGIHRSQWPNAWMPRPPNLTNQNNIINTKAKGKQLVDFETLSCLMVILFLDDSKINTGRLHRVIRNLCYHNQTRMWMLKSLLSVLEKSNESYLFLSDDRSVQCSINRPSPSKNSFPPDMEKRVITYVELVPSWLNISLDSALGCSANVFQIYKATGSAKKMGTEHRFISIHSKAVSQIARHTIDALSNLAKSFPAEFLPHTIDIEVKILNTDSCVTADSKSRVSSACLSTSTKSKSNETGDFLFWDYLLKLDGAISGKKGKSLAKMGLHITPLADHSQTTVSFEASGFGKLITMLAYKFIRRTQLLTDKLLRLLSLISLGIPETSGYGKKVLLEGPSAPVDESMLISESHLRLIVEVITSKGCSEEGLEEATALLLNLSFGPPATRNKILALLTEGVRDLGIVVCSHIVGLISELKALQLESEKEEDCSANTSETDACDKVFKGMLTDRFTKETVVITSATKSKTNYELQLPSMASLTSKTSSQAFFLRLLKVIMNLRELIRGAIKKHKQKGVATADPEVTGESQQLQQRRRNLNRVESLVAQQFGFTRELNFTQVDSPRTREDLLMEIVFRGSEHAPSTSSSVSAPPPPPVISSASVAGSSSSAQNQNTTTESNIKDETVVDEAKLLPRLSVELQLEELWSTLSECLLALGHAPDHHAVLVLQPAVEAFFLVHTFTVDAEEKKKNTRETRETQLSHLEEELPPVVTSVQSTNDSQNDTEMMDSQNNSGIDSSLLPTNLPPDTRKFLSFAETHRTVLNHILRQSTTHLADGPFAVLVDHTRVLDFDVKRRYFRTELDRLDEGVRREDLAVHVRRQHVFEDSFRELHRKTAEEWKNRFYIVFEGEEGQDAGGLLREWYVIISREIFNPMYALFTISPGDRVTYMINSSSHCNSNHLFYFKFVGRVIAKAIYDNKLLECYFTRSFYKHILGKYVKHIDMESEDYAFFQGLAFLMDNHISELGYDLTFSTEVQEFGVTEVRDLITNGRNIAVTEENKTEYVRLVCQMKMTGAIRKQLNAFLEGFYDIIPKRLISIFNEQELELLVSGLPNVDIEDLKANTEYHKYQSNSLQIQWFWRALRSFDQADRAKFLQFVTGTSKVPLQGFGSLEGMNGVQKFQIHRDDRSTDRLPSAHTCFNQLDLPAYETYDKLRTYMLKAIHECSEGFGFA